VSFPSFSNFHIFKFSNFSPFPIAFFISAKFLTFIQMKTYKVIGIMSGTSLDGLDLAYCHFIKEQDLWNFEILKAETIEYDAGRRDGLTKIMEKSALDITLLHASLGSFIGKEVALFIKKHSLTPDFVSSHGHTIFHQPSKSVTLQIGSGAHLSAGCGLPVVCDFRSLDVALGGQGAPLVPIGDKLLFSDYEFCLNLGGIANISFEYHKKRIAFDICPVNIVLNQLALSLGHPFDEGGLLAKKGKVNNDLLKLFNAADFYKQAYPKSLGKEWVDKNIFPLLQASKISVEDKLCTFCEHIAVQINAVITNAGLSSSSKLLITGGGAFNQFLINRIKALSSGKVNVAVPDKNTIMFKEALIFAFLGVLRVRNEVNCLSSVTGASKDNMGGALYGNFSQL
jgi:anhydro-N-acetylmuramic acid kinase